MDTKEFTFLGFLPLNKKLRKNKLEEVQKSNKTVVIYESPHKIENTLKDLRQILDDNRKITLAREITKIHEEFIRGSIDELIKRIEKLKGEMVLIIDGNTQTDCEEKWDSVSLEEHYFFYEKQGFSKKEIIKKIAKDRKMAKNEIYQKFI